MISFIHSSHQHPSHVHPVQNSSPDPPLPLDTAGGSGGSRAARSGASLCSSQAPSWARDLAWGASVQAGQGRNRCATRPPRSWRCTGTVCNSARAQNHGFSNIGEDLHCQELMYKFIFSGHVISLYQLLLLMDMYMDVIWCCPVAFAAPMMDRV